MIPEEAGAPPLLSDQMTISSSWIPALEGNGPESIQAFREFLTTIDFEKLAHIAAVIRGVGRASPEINPKIYQRGALNVIFEILFLDGVSWVARISLPQATCYPESTRPPDAFLRERKFISKSEVDTQKYVRENTSIPVPEIFHADLSYDGGGVGAPYILMEGIQGKKLRAEFAKLPLDVQEKVYRQVARVVIELSNLTFPRIGLLRANKENVVEPSEWYDGFGLRHPPCRSSASYYKRIYGLYRARTLSSTDRDEKALAWMWDRCSVHIRGTLGPHGPFPLCHGDLWSGNFLWDDELNLVAVIDWTNTMAMPWEFSAMIPEFYLNQSEEVQIARQRFENILKTEEMKVGRVRRVSDLFSSPCLQILCLIKDVHFSVRDASHVVPRLISLMPGVDDVKFVNHISPKYIERCTLYRHTRTWYSYKDNFPPSEKEKEACQ